MEKPQIVNSSFNSEFVGLFNTDGAGGNKLQFGYVNAPVYDVLLVRVFLVGFGKIYDSRLTGEAGEIIP